MSPDAALRMAVYQEGQRSYNSGAPCPYVDWRAETWKKGRDAAQAHYQQLLLEAASQDAAGAGMGKHTPGPWRVKGTRIYGLQPGIDCIATMQVSNQENWDADARLIAAAPDLLEALQKFVAWSKAESDHAGTTFWERVEMLRDLDASAAAAIAKATGEQQP